MQEYTLAEFHQSYVIATQSGAVVKHATFHICNVTQEVMMNCGFYSPRVNISTRTMKHLYDKRPAEEFDFLLQYLELIVRYPDKIYRNADKKNADLVFIKSLKGLIYFCAIQKSSGAEETNSVVTTFRVKKQNYMKNYKLLWSWKVGAPSS